jgi:hypothetical protein
MLHWSEFWQRRWRNEESYLNILHPVVCYYQWHNRADNTTKGTHANKQCNKITDASWN